MPCARSNVMRPTAVKSHPSRPPAWLKNGLTEPEGDEISLERPAVSSAAKLVAPAAEPRVSPLPSKETLLRRLLDLKLEFRKKELAESRMPKACPEKPPRSLAKNASAVVASTGKLYKPEASREAREKSTEKLAVALERRKRRRSPSLESCAEVPATSAKLSRASKAVRLVPRLQTNAYAKERSSS
eukprot:TRINITY_DN10628_c0_g1_i2.p1 TRINITY_DN10628_c0_g1~~TRINITY_DN10628_c0_g1_i2.p1  ORF type:complete len:212 (+),score=27.71 TRINITY_DN10628_c0_g1_i2:80-637(+)